MHRSTSSLLVKENQQTRFYNCPRCQKFYEASYHGGLFSGRLPLILPCKHSLCEGCIRTTLIQGSVKCPICDDDFKVPKNTNTKDDFFPINYHILGYLFIKNPTQFVDKSTKLHLQPAGTTFMNRFKPIQRSSSINSSFSNDSDLESFRIDDYDVDSCSQERCHNSAEVTCYECDEKFCKLCSDKLHRSAKGLQSHSIVAFEAGLDTTFEKCSIHNENLQYKCADCDVELCSHCVIIGHRDHEIQNFTSLEEEKLEHLKELLEGAEEVLKRLQATYKETNKKTQPNVTNDNDALDTQKSIGKYFGNLHGRLQLLESKLLQDVEMAKSKRNRSLKKISKNLEENILTLKRVLKAGRCILNPQSSLQQMNIGKVTDCLERSLEAPCFLSNPYDNSVEEGEEEICFVTTNNIEEFLEENIVVTVSNNIGEFKLISISEMPLGTEMMPENIEENDDTSQCQSLSSIHSELHGSRTPQSQMSSRITGRTMTNVAMKAMQSSMSARLQEASTPTRLCKGARVNVLIKHINNPDSFFVQLKNEQSNFERLSGKIDNHVKSFATRPFIPEKNGIYAVCYEYNGGKNREWCRARVNDILIKQGEAESYNVFYIDYGNTQCVQHDAFRQLPDALIRVPPFAVHCKIFNLFPLKKETWSREATGDMAQMVTGEGVMEIMDDDNPQKLEVDLKILSKDEQATNIGEALTFLGHGRVELRCSRGVRNTNKPKFKHNVSLYKMNYECKENVPEQVIITNINNPFDIHVQLKQNQTYIENLKETMTKFYKSRKGNKIFNPYKDMCVAVNCPLLSGWVRGLVVDTATGGKVEVFLVDYGRTICVSYTMLQKLNEKFSTLDMQAINVQLADILALDEPFTDSNNEHVGNMNEFLNQKYLGKEVSMVVKLLLTSPIEVYLYGCLANKYVCINALLVEQGFAEFTTDSKCPVIQCKERGEDLEIKKRKKLQKREARRLSLSTTATSPEQQDYTISSSNGVPIEILKIYSPSKFYVKFLSLENTLFQLQQQMLEFYAVDQPPKKEFEINHLCVVYSARNKHYCRAIIEEVKVKGAKDSIKVFLVDKAEEEIIAMNHVYDMQMEFQPKNEAGKTCCPFGAIKCFLSGIKPAGGDPNKWTLTACDSFKDIVQKYGELLLSRSGTIHQKTKALPVKLWGNRTIPGSALEPSKSEIVLVNDELVQNGLALPLPVLQTKSPVPPDVVPQRQQQEITDWLPALPITDTEIIGIPTYVDDFGIIYFHPKAVRELVDMMESYIDDEFRNVLCDRNQLRRNWKAGDLCTVKYHHNGKWYRGKIVSRNMANGLYAVRMVDYGNVEDVRTDEIRPEVIHPEVRVFASTCRLYNVYPRDGAKWITSDVDALHARVVDKDCLIRYLHDVPPVDDHPLVVITEGMMNINGAMVKHFGHNLTNQNPHNSTPSSSGPDLDNDDVVIETVADDSVRSVAEDDVVIETDSDAASVETPVPCSTPRSPGPQHPEATNTDFSFKPRNQRNYEFSNIDNMDKFCIAIVNIIAYDEIVVENTTAARNEDIQERFAQVSEEINALAKDQRYLSIYELRVGTPCVALFEDDQKWYRAQVTEQIKPRTSLVGGEEEEEEQREVDEEEEEEERSRACTVKVWFVDYGNFDNVSVSNIRYIRDKWLRLPLIQYKCKIANLPQQPLDDDDDDEQWRVAVFDRLCEHIEQLIYAQVVCKGPQMSLALFKDPQCTESLFEGL